LDHVIRFVGPNRALELFGVKLVGINAENGKKLLFTLVLVAMVMGVNRLLRRVVRGATKRGERTAFSARQGIGLISALLILIGIMSIWFDDPTRLTTAMGLVTARLAFALQRVVTALAGYVLILRGKTFNVGDRIAMGGVRGDVVALGFLQTTIMEMGQPPPVQNADPAMWVRARQYTGRLVSMSNAQVFDDLKDAMTRDVLAGLDALGIGIASATFEVVGLPTVEIRRPAVGGRGGGGRFGPEHGGSHNGG
jgi:small-conductance mechanosensitive channel